MPRLWRYQAKSGPYCPNREELGRKTLDFSAGPPVCRRRLSLVKPKRKPENPGVSLVWLMRTSSRAQSREGRVERDPAVGAIGQESAQCLRDCSTEISIELLFKNQFLNSPPLYEWMIVYLISS